MRKQPQNNLMALPSTDPPVERRGFLGRLFTNENGHDQTEMQKLESAHALARRAIHLDTDLARCRRQGNFYLETTLFEDRSVKEIKKELKYHELCEQVDDLFDDELEALLLKERIRQIYRGTPNKTDRKRKRS